MKCSPSVIVRRGQALVEAGFAIVVLLLIVMGLIQYGIIYNTTTTLLHITRSGARFAGVHGAESPVNYNGTATEPDAAIRRYIHETALPTSVPPEDIPDAAITISPSAGDLNRKGGKPITVTIAYDMRKKLFLPSSFPGLSRFGANYKTSSTIIIEGN